MVGQFSALTLFAALTTALTCGLGVLGWSKRHQPGSAFFALLMFAASAWALALTLGSAAVTPRAKIFFGILEYPGVVSIPVLWFLFAADYTRRDRWLTRRWQLILWIIPALTLILAFTNEWHRLLWRDIVPGDSPDVFVYQRGPYFWVHLVYSYAWFVAGTWLLLATLRQSKGMYRRQSLAIVLAAFIPWLGNLIYILDLSPIHGFDVTPLAFALAGIIFTFFSLKNLDKNEIGA